MSTTENALVASENNLDRNSDFSLEESDSCVDGFLDSLNRPGQVILKILVACCIFA